MYRVKNELWKKAGMRDWGGCLCVGCLEKRLGRQLRPRDFARRDKTWAELPCTDRLLDRRGFRRIRAMTKHGEKELIIDKKAADEMAKAAPPGELPYVDDD